MVSVLCAARNSVYKSLQDVSVYDIDRDCRTFDMLTPVVAHPPCRAWSAFCSHQAKPAPGEKELAPFCVEAIRQCGGVLEHPAHSKLWKELNLPKPDEGMRDGLWTVALNQSWFGDIRSKRTWLLVSGIRVVNVPVMPHCVSGDRQRWNTMSKSKRAATPMQFAKWLLMLARQSSVGGSVA